MHGAVMIKVTLTASYNAYKCHIKKLTANANEKKLNATGKKTFQHNCINWSYRKRGTLARTIIKKKQKKRTLNTKNT